MTIQECKKATLRLLNQYSIAGTEVPTTYNDQEDDLNRMLDLINDAQLEIATVARPIEAFTTIVVPEVDSSVPIMDIETSMPSDFNHCANILFTPSEGRDRRAIKITDFRWLSDDILLLPNRPFGTYKIVYERFPIRYTSSTPDTTELDNTPDTHVIIPYFVAAMIALDDNAKAYSALYNVWETRLARLNMKPAYTVTSSVQDVYGFDNFSGVI